MTAPLAATAQKDPDVGNVTMNPKKTLVGDLALSPIHKRLLDALKQTGMADTLGGSGPYTVFAPTDDAFAKLGASALTTLLQPESKARLTALLQYHVVAGKLTSGKLGKMVKKGKGAATLQTLQGGALTVKKSGSIYILTDAKGGTAVITTPDVQAKNGYFHVIDTVLMPN